MPAAVPPFHSAVREERKMPRKDQVSIKTIAEKTGLSTATVSRVINKKGGFTRETYERVQKAVRELDYVPNAMARGLRTRSVPLVGIIVPDIINEFFSRIVLRVQLALAARGYSVFICNTDESAENERTYLATLQGMQISGLVCISGSDMTDEAWPNVPTVYIDRNPIRPAPRSTIIESDNLSGGWMAATELLRRGCREIALLGDERSLSTALSRRNGFQQALNDAGLVPEESRIFSVAKVDEKNAYDAVSFALRSGVTFDGLFCMTDWLALGALKALENAHLRVPGQVRVVGFDDVRVASYSALPITTIRQDTDEMSRLAVEELTRMMEGEPCRRPHWIVPVSLIRRETT